MKNLKWMASLMIVGSLFAGCGTAEEPAVQSEVEANGEVWTSYGEQFEVGEPKSLTDVAALLDSTGEASGQFEVEIVETCTKMGCWMTVNGPDGEPVMVYMKDHAFFVPKAGMQGKRAIISGYAYNDTVSVELQKHLLEDANRPQEEIDAVTEVKYELAFSAAGVKIEGHIEPEVFSDDHEDHDHEGHDHESEGQDGHAHDGEEQEGHAH